MRYYLTLTAVLALATTACKITDSQLQEDLFFPDNENQDQAGYLTWVVGERPANGSADNRHICRAICKTDPVAKSEELGYEKLSDVRNTCDQATARSISFARLDASVHYKGVVNFADSTQKIEYLAPYEDKVVLAGLLRTWQDRTNSYSANGVLEVRGITEINVKREAIVSSLFSDDALIYLDPAIEKERDAFNARAERMLQEGFTDKVQYFTVPSQAKRRIDSCFTAQAAGIGTTEDKQEAANNAVASPANNWEAAEVDKSKAIEIKDPFAFNYLKGMFGQCLTRRPSAELTLDDGGKTSTYRLQREGNDLQVHQVSPEHLQSLITFAPTNDRVIVSTPAVKIATVPSQVFDHALKLWIYDLKIGGRSAAPIEECKPGENAWLNIPARLPMGFGAEPLTLNVGFVRFKGEGTGGWIEFANPEPSLEDQFKNMRKK